MDQKKKDDSAEAEQTSETSRKTTPPLKTIVLENVLASIFAHDHRVSGAMRRYYSVTFSRSYRDKFGTWQYVKSFNLEDLGRVVTVAQQAQEFLENLTSPQIEK